MKRLFIFGVLLLLTVPVGVFAASRTLYLGLSGSDVITLQKILIAKGYLPAGKDSGYFGALTQAALQKFQCDHNVVCSGTGYGVYGPKTQTVLAAILAAADNPTQVKLSAMTPPATGAFEVSGWIPSWRAATGTADVLPNLGKLKSVMPFAYSVASDGTLIDGAHFGNDPWPVFFAAAKQQHVRVVPTVMWGNGVSIESTLSNTQKRIALENSIADLVKRQGYDGIDIDFEAKQQASITYFSTFLKGLYSRMGNKWLYCTVEARMPLEDRYAKGTTIPADATDYANDYVEMNKYCDRVEIMAYDQGTVDVRLNNARSAPYAPVADPGWVEEVVTLAARTISRNKLIIGIPTYGYEYSVTPVASGYQYKVLWAFNPRYATDIAAQLGITPTRTSADELGFTYNPALLAAIAPLSGNSTQTQQTMESSTVAQNSGSQVTGNGTVNFMTWSDSKAINDKVALAHRLGVRGVAVFKFDGGEDAGMWFVLK